VSQIPHHVAILRSGTIGAPTRWLFAEETRRRPTSIME
jgi:hypothetical protein